MLVFTSCINNYIPKARVLASTLKSFHPDWTFCLLLGEAPPADFHLDEEPFDRLMGFDELAIPNYRSWLFRHRVVEICTAAKGPALHHFLTCEKHEKVMYLDPDIMVCNPLTPLETLLDEHDFLLTPHQLTPQKTEQSIKDNELITLRHGAFNLGFVAAARRGDGLAFARWWRNRLLKYCYDDIPNGLFTDQRWCDLAPVFFPGLHIVRDPGCNVASWNLPERAITQTENGIFLANGSPLRFYHFTGFDSGAGDGMTARYGGNVPAVRELWQRYRERLAASGQALLGKQRWAYMSFSDGTPITDAMRLLYRERKDLQTTFPDPFRLSSYRDWYRMQRWLPARVFGKTKSIAKRIHQILERNGGFPRGIPGMLRQIVTWSRRWGAMGLLKNIWQSTPVIPFTKRLHLNFALESPDSSEYQLLTQLLDPSNMPTCLLEHDWGGGAASYCEKRVQQLLDEKKAVIRLRYTISAQRFEMTVCHGAETLSFELSDINTLSHMRFPRITKIIVNELAGWYYNGGNPQNMIAKLEATIPTLIQVADHHQANLELLFHDFYSLCPTIFLLTPQRRYCGVKTDYGICDPCALRGQSFSMGRWRQTWEKLVERADELVFFSENTRKLVGKVFLLKDEKIRIRPHGVPKFDTTLDIPQNGPMRIAVVGNIQVHKGMDIVLDLAHLLEKRMPDATIIVLGTLDAPRVPANVLVLGPYEHEELPALLEKHQATIGLFPSICPETFSFVVRELASLGLPLVSFDLGAQGEFVGTLPNGRLVKEISAESALDALLALDAATRETPRSTS